MVKSLVSLSVYCMLLVFGAFIFLVAFSSCQKCELIDQEIVYPSNPCNGALYFLRLESAFDTIFTFNTLSKPITNPANPILKEGTFGFPFFLGDFRSSFSAYDSVSRTYSFEYFNPSNTTIGFYSNQITSNISTKSTFLDLYVSPVSQMGHTYVIVLETLGTDLQYSIGEVNPVTGQDGVGLVENTVTINSPADPQYFSSAAGKDGLVYFLGGTNLIEFNSINNTTRHIDLDPSFHEIENPVGFSGLEYDRNQDLFYCLRTALDNGGNFYTTLVSIKVASSGTQLAQVFDVGAKLPAGHSPRINPDFHATAFDPCDTTYYITELNTFKPLTTNFIEIALNRQSLVSQVVQGYLLGLEVVE
jgi:hypothetical protein